MRGVGEATQEGLGERRVREAPPRKDRLRAGRLVLAALLVVALVTGAGVGAYRVVWSHLSATSARIDRMERTLEQLSERVSRIEQVQRLVAPARVEVYFSRSTPEGELEMVRVERPAPPASAPEDRVRLAIQAMLQGPSPGETSGQSLYTQIPEGTRLLSVRLQGETAFLNFSREFEQTGGTQRLAGMLRQVVFTATAVPPVRKVVLLVEGEQVGTETHPFTGDGLLFGELSRDALPL
ncbi:GerMN domain-containing protein [Carboxydochorda subterranea]|uniref:GerMN domain-containing protein n=1 Tax=Carboxydichorda subterranea TaxID=3109565 RepID=A0ABZ1BYL4_9FIRM|nr:GerMN domain-containing protein [Limnochorda sp. L945t]WRP17811.1 GerMN domain-containing protein [Limnochorda sp. L945t]